MCVYRKWGSLVVACVIVTSVPGCGGSGTDPPELLPPYAAFTVTPDAGDTGTLFRVDAAACADDNDPPESLRVRWDWEGDGTFDTGYTIAHVAEHRYPDAGWYAITLEVQDSDGMTAIAERTVLVDEQDSSMVVIVE